MRSFLRAMLVLILMSCMMLVVPTGIVSQEMDTSGQKNVIPVNVHVNPGSTPINYAGQTLVFTTTVELNVTLKVIPGNKIEMRVQTDPPGGGGNPGGNHVGIYWENWQQYIYDDNPPVIPWIVILFMEGGFTEK